MTERACNTSEQTEKKAYVEPTLERAQKLEDVTEGTPAVVTPVR